MSKRDRIFLALFIGIVTVSVFVPLAIILIGHFLGFDRCFDDAFISSTLFICSKSGRWVTKLVMLAALIPVGLMLAKFLGRIASDERSDSSPDES